ncbi:uncharacterized protein LOC129592937 [Paramacrobiotus metropolitanus]|uniref:uncharacterized protein LOC129592937 n=1 Tax=Paramacrobiotus metropolitanus TaxID=2943436 RepID=UPI0024462048|nr:uncharacterized protein LOC129592937 [Paramacrobiotus metropolitanus]
MAHGDVIRGICRPLLPNFSMAHWCLGLQSDPLNLSLFTFVTSFLICTLGLMVLDFAFDVWDVYHMWIKNPYRIHFEWRIVMSLIVILPSVVSFIRFLCRSALAGAPNIKLNWSRVTDRLITNTDITLVPSESEHLDPEYGLEHYLPQWLRKAYVKRFCEIYPLSILCRSLAFMKDFKLHREDPQKFRDTYMYKRDPTFQLLFLQKAQLDEIKFESAPQLVIQLLLAALAWASQGTPPPFWKWIIIFFAFFSIAKYFPAVNHLPGMCSANNRLLAEKDYIEWKELTELLKPNVCNYAGVLANQLYIMCRYCHVASLFLYNYACLVLVTIVQMVIIAVFMVVLFKKEYGRKAETPADRAKGCGKNLLAFVAEWLYVVGHFLVVPIASTMTRVGMWMATLLQLCSFVVYMVAFSFDWSSELNSMVADADEVLVQAEKHGSLLFHILAAADFLSLLALPACHFAMNACWKDIEKWSHFEECKTCSDLRDRYLHYRPCWLCEWKWCHSGANNPVNNNAETAPSSPTITTGSCCPGSTPALSTTPSQRTERRIPYIAPFSLSQNEWTEADWIAQCILQLLAEVPVTQEEEDFLLCPGHFKLMNNLRTSAPNALASRCVNLANILLTKNGTNTFTIPLLRPFGVQDRNAPETTELSLPTDMLKFLTTLYELLEYSLPEQLLFKGSAYGRGIFNHDQQQACWQIAKFFRRKHSACNKCVLQEITVHGAHSYLIQDETMQKLLEKIENNSSATDIIAAVIPGKDDIDMLERVKMFLTRTKELRLDNDRSGESVPTDPNSLHSPRTSRLKKRRCVLRSDSVNKQNGQHAPVKLPLLLRSFPFDNMKETPV